MKTKNFWQIKQKENTNNLFYVLAYVPPAASNRFFIFRQSLINEMMKKYETSGIKYDPRFSGINWGMALSQENMWSELPLSSEASAVA